MSRVVDPTCAFRGEGEDMIAALIEASKIRPMHGTNGDGSATFAVDGEVVKGKRSFERELVPFDFGDEADKANGTNGTNGGGMLRNIPAPRAPGSPAPMVIPAPKTPGETGRKKNAKKGAADSNDPRVRANQVCEPQKSMIPAEQQQAILAAQGDKKKGKSGKMDPAKHQVWTSGERYAQSSFQNAPSADQLPMPSFLREMAPVEPVTANASMPRPVSAPPASADDLKNLLKMKPATPPPLTLAPPSAAKGQALFNSILNSATNKDLTPQMAPPPVPMPHTMMPPHVVPAQTYGATPQGAPVHQKLNAIFGVPPQPAQPFPVPQAYPTAPETTGGNFQTLMSKLNAGRV